VSEAAPGLSVDSVTGIDVSLPLAGPGARAYAFTLDWHVRLVLALGWYAAGALLYNGQLSLAPPLLSDVRWFGLVVVPALALYFLYHPILEVALRGSTPGKRMAGVRVVARDGSAPGVGALLVRNVFRLIDSLPVFYGLGLALVVLTREHVRCGDMAAGTLLVYERTGSEPALAQHAAERLGRLDATGAELVAELLGRWRELSAPARAELARRLIARYSPGSTVTELDDAQLRARLEELGRPAAGTP